MIPTDDIHGQILAALHDYIGISPADMMPTDYGDICELIMSIRGVASVGLPYGNGHPAGCVDAAVELTDGEVITVHITEPSTDSNGVLEERIEALECKIILQDAWIGDVKLEADRMIAGLDVRLSVRLADIEANFNARLASLQSQITALKPHPWLPIPTSIINPRVGLGDHLVSTFNTDLSGGNPIA